MRVNKDKKVVLKISVTLIIAIIFLLPGQIPTAVSNEFKLEINNLVSYNYVNDNELLISFNLQDLIQNQIKTDQGIFTIFKIPNAGFSGSIGRPQLPIVSCLYAVPTLDLSFKIIDAHVVETSFIDKVYPSQMPQTDSDVDEIFGFVIDEEFYQQDIEYPGMFADIVYKGKIRDICFVKIEFYPIQYNPIQETATIYDEITISLSWNENDIVSVESDFNHAPFFSFYKNVFSNWQGFLGHTQIIESSVSSDTISQEEGCEYLIITHPDFYTKTSELADWKYSKGMITKVVDTDEIGGSANEIKQYIQNAYDTWEPRPSYILLVGDNEFIPTSSSGTDLYYTTVDGSDYYPDIYIGRIPADTLQESNIMIQKILKYEQDPPASSGFYNNFVVAAYFQDDENDGYETRRFVRTSEEIRDYLLSEDFNGERIYCTEPYINPTNYNDGDYGDGEPLPEELLRPDFAWEGNADDIINAIENGIFILNHRDHGFEDGWGDPYFDTNHVHGLTNGDLLPVVFSINCLSGKFDYYECFCEEFVRQEGGGAVAAFGASRTSYSGYNDYLCRGFYDAQWPEFDPEVGSNEPMYKLGQLLNYGKTYMAETWGDPWGLEETTFKLFHCFGDPTMEIWTSFPKELDFEYRFTGESLEITVIEDDSPIDGALVCLSQDSSGFYAKGLTDSNGEIIIDTTSAIIDEEVTIVISAHNYLSNFKTFVLNQPPKIPNKPEGPERGIIYRELTYSISTTDPEGDQVFYKWCWGDGHFSEWLGPFNSGETVTESNRWYDEASFFIKVKAKDIYDQETDWSEYLHLIISKNRALNSGLISLLDLFFKIFPMQRLILGLGL